MVHAEPDKLWLDSMEPVQAGATIRQDRLLGSLTDLFQTFNDEWGRRWNKHCRTEISAWQSAVATAMIEHPEPEACFPEITPAQWRKAVSAKKASSAAGLDGISRQDLMLIPDDLLQHVLAIYAHAEATGVWPTQAMQAVISALEKRPDATRVEHYRPITIISLVYRVWSGIRAKQCLRHLLQYCATTQNGCLPSRSAACVWYDTQAGIELARRAGVARHGIVTDVIKAFNCIPRPPVYALAILLGVPKPIVKGWQGALHLLNRRFRIRSSVGPGVQSHSGYPEGCGMSCTAAVLLGISYHRFMAAMLPSMLASSYVDNLAGVSADVSDISAATRALRHWADAWDLQLDETVVWSTCAKARSLLRQQGLQVILDGPDLGGHMQYAMRRTNFGLVARISAFESAWLRLGSSQAGYQPKLMAVRMAGWPAALHGSSLVHVGSRHFEQLRTLPSRPRSHQGGLSPVLSEWPGPDSPPSAHIGSLSFPDAIGTWDPWQVSKQELQYRLEMQWQHVVATATQHRPGFQEMQQVDALLTRSLVGQFQPDAQAILRVALTGRFFTEKELHHIGQADQPVCPFCGQEDGVLHRVQHCPAFQADREAHLSPLQGDLDDIVPAQREHAWSLRADGLRELQALLQGIEFGEAPQLATPPVEGQLQHLFVDGSCLLPRVHQLRLASWSVVLAGSEDPSHSEILAVGHLPSFLQTSFRAEIFAAFKALQLAESSEGAWCIWSDCAGVVARLQQYLDGGSDPGLSRATVTCGNPYGS